MKRIFTLFLFCIMSTMYSQNNIDSAPVSGDVDYKLEKLRELSKKIFVIATMDEEMVYSVRFDSENSFGKRFWIKASHKVKRVKNKKGNWVDHKKKDYSMTLININCSGREYEVLKIVNYDGNDKVVSSIDGDGTSEYIVPDSNMEIFSNIICY